MVVLCCEDWTKEFLKKTDYPALSEDPHVVVRGTGMLKKLSKFKSILIK
jgi:hypothetical protein